MDTGTECECRHATTTAPVQRVRSARVSGPLLALVASLWLPMIAASDALAQQGGGLKLGEESESTIDLGPAPVTAPATTEDAPDEEGRAARNDKPDTAPSADPPEITKHGDWEVACAPGGENCFMTQEGRDKDGKTALRIMIEPLPEPQEVEDQTVIAVIDIVTPLGVVLNVGLAFTVDDQPTSLAPFQICTVEGCLVREPVTEEVINSLKRGRMTNIRFVVANYGEVSSDISLTGFTAAYNSL